MFLDSLRKGRVDAEMSVFLVALLVAVAPPPKPANAAAPAEGRSIMVLSDLGVGPAQGQARDLADAVNQEVRRSLQFAWRDPPAISVDELILALNCSNMDEACLKRAADQLKTDAILFVAARPSPKGPEVVITLVHAKPPRPARVQTAPLSDPASTQARVRQAARALLGPIKPTQIAVASNPAGAQVLMDGNLLGTTPTTVNDVPDGPHALVLKLAGFQDRTVDVNVRAGESQELNVALVPMSDPAAAPTATSTPTAPAAEAPVATAPTNPLQLPLMAAGGGVAALGAAVLLAAVGLLGGGLSSWGAYWAVILLNPGFAVGGTTLRIGSEPTRAGGFATMANAQRFGVLAYVLFFPGIAGAVFATLMLAAGAAVAAVPFALGSGE